MRHLFYVPIIHSEADLGSLGDVVKRSVTESQGREAWAERQRRIEATWTDIRTALLALPISWSKTRIYQDGLPVCNNELAIVKDVAAKGSHNHRLLLELIEQGAMLMGTEDPSLLIRDYERIQRLMKLATAPLRPNTFQEIKRAGEVLLQQRDVFIAERIDSTLQEDENGILLIGFMHRVHELLGGRSICLRHIHINLLNGAEKPPNSEAHQS
jgi:hypothetical protein